MIGITLGDPSGIGPEIIAATLMAGGADALRRVHVFGDTAVVARAFESLGAQVPAGLTVSGGSGVGVADVPLGLPTPAGAAAQVAYLEAAVTAAKAGTIDALVTAPISKLQVASVGFGFPGHTEFLAARFGAERVAMMFVGPTLTVVLATIHLALVEVPEALTGQRIIDATELGVGALRERLGVGGPRVGVVALNPHAGEGGLMGTEERDVIEPAIAECRRRFGAAAEVVGPVVPDAAFRQGVEGRYDLLVAMYHDQALIPVKAVDFDRSVNCTLGLPIVRTSPDHGVAYDIAGQGKARADSFAAALELAVRMTERS